ncbi:chloride channel protein [Flexivirga caeni]|uniref:Chloride ion channel protein n=1 Tax=Flexivirga caeni TaxID=2294115 RepID=A0A3M9MGH1_9MICO|nr:chloride channel protein [Flexivirga caeni]RNI24616.1 chloride ion channel protein [Flexivirga caeni]
MSRHFTESAAREKPAPGAVGAPNAVHRIATLGLAIVAAGLLSGIAGVTLTFVLRAVEHLTFGYSGGGFLTGVETAPDWRRVVGPAVGGLLSGAGWWLVRRHRHVPSLNDIVRDPAATRHLGTVVVDAFLQVLVVGSGASIGREGAPRQTAAVLASAATQRLRLADPARQALIAGAAGAGLSAVYNTPIAGALFAVEVILRTRRLSAAAISLSVSFLGTSVLWFVHGTAPTYHLPGGTTDWVPVALWSIVAIVPCLLLGRVFSRITSAAQDRHTGPTVRLVVSIGSASAILGLIGWWAPELFGNGKAVIDAIADGDRSLLLLVALVALKPLVTAMFLRTGATGGLLTPSMATGAAFGASVAVVLRHFGVPADVPSFALVAAAGCLATTQEAPFFAVFFTWELARPAPWELICFLITAIGATAIYRMRHPQDPTQRRMALGRVGRRRPTRAR